MKFYGGWREDVTTKFDVMYSKISEGENVFQQFDIQNFVVLFVPGLYSGKIPGNTQALEVFDDRMKKLEEQGLTAYRVQVPTDAGVIANSNIIASAVQDIHRTTNKSVVLVGHSKGAVDISVAITLYPQIRAHIKCFISMQSPFFGAGVATDLQTGNRKTVVDAMIREILHCDPIALYDTTKEARQKFLLEHPYPKEEVPTLSFVSTAENLDRSFLSFLYKYVKTRHGENDGLVGMNDGIIPGSDFVLISGMSHYGAYQNLKIKYNNPSFLVMALIATGLQTAKAMTIEPIKEDYEQKPSSIYPSLQEFN